MKYFILVMICCVFLTGCKDRSDYITEYGDTTNVRWVGGNYVMYDIDNNDGGIVTCREHQNNGDYSCWKKY